MVFLVPFDGSPVSEAALERAVEHGKALDEEVVAVSFVPTGTDYAQRRKWIEPDEDFAAETATAALRRKIEEATDDSERMFDEVSAQSPADGITEDIRQVATDVGASTLFVGASSDPDEDRLTTPFGDLAPDADYDVHIVRTR